jgi:hypothetical protein
MSNTSVERPPAPEKKIKTSDNFELCFLRHQYFRRVNYNPTEEEMKPYMGIVVNLTKNTFFTYVNLFKAVGMYHDDVVNIGRVHLVSFLGLYALDKMKDKRKEWMTKFQIDNDKEPEQKDFDQKNKANFTMFFKQRMEDLVRVCRQKVRNIKGQSTEEFAVFCGKNRLPRNPKRLLKEYEEYGYKKIDFSVFKSIRKKADVEHDATAFQFGGVWYVAIALEQKALEIEDLITSDSNPYENRHNMQPDELYLTVPINDPDWNSKKGKHVVTKEERESEDLKRLFNRKSNYRKKVVLRKFIANNKNKAQYKEEIVTAKKLLRSLGE